MPAYQSALSVPCSPETACAHCGLPVGSRPVGADPFFCCTGCSVVYQTLCEAGFDATYYRLRDLATTGTARPAQTDVDLLHVSELDTPAFLETHARAHTDGTFSVDLFLDGVHCAACVWLVERLPFELEGVTQARLDLPRARLSLRFDPSMVPLSHVVHWLARFGYRAHPSRTEHLAQRSQTESRLLIRLGVCWALAGNVMLLAFALYAGLDLANDPTMATAARWTSLALATISVGYGGSVFFRRAWASVRLALRRRDGRSLHMDTPISLGILVGYGHSAYATLMGTGDIWFDSITVLIAALLTARWLQLRSSRLAGDATDRLLSLIPSMARRVRSDGTHETVRIDEVQPGDRIYIPAGEVFPVDGTILTGRSTINNAVLTGESRPMAVEPGLTVEAGATNLKAPLIVQLTAAGEATRVGRLLAWIRAQEGRDADVVLLADRLSGAFVAGVLVLATLAALLWSMLDPSQAVQHVVALLVISCPCALGMATPLAMAVASGRAARTGLFIKTEAAIQQLTAVDAIVLDKTGTLTEGRMTLAATCGSSTALELAAALEIHSNHPIAAAFVEAHGADPACSSQPDMKVTEVEVVTGAGLRGQVDGYNVAVGRPDWIAALTGGLADDQQVQVATYAARGHTPVAIAVDGECRAVAGVGDRLRPESAMLVARLQARGKRIFLLSGDHSDVVAAVARDLGLDPHHALGTVTPEAKRQFVENLKRMHTVAMVGDGVNDAAALQAADVGIAVQGGSTPSLVAADVFLTREGLKPVLELLDGAHRVMRVVRGNLAFSLLYNGLGATAALLGLITPLVAAIAMPISSLIVVSTSVLQRSFRVPTSSPVPNAGTTVTRTPAFVTAPSSISS